jgi:hypothetical protein
VCVCVRVCVFVCVVKDSQGGGHTQGTFSHCQMLQVTATLSEVTTTNLQVTPLVMVMVRKTHNAYLHVNIHPQHSQHES